MSRQVAALVYSRQVGSMARKAVLAYFAERANDDGTGIWSSKQRIADEIECSKQTVIATTKALIADGLVIEAGQHRNQNGYTVVYNIMLSAVAALPQARLCDQEVQISTGQKLDRSERLTPRGQAALPKPSLNRPNSQRATPSSRGRGNRISERTLPDWVPAAEWTDYAAMREGMAKGRQPKPWTPSVAQKAIEALGRLVQQGQDPAAVLDQSVLEGWRGLYPIKEGRRGQGGKSAAALHRLPLDRQEPGL